MTCSITPMQQHGQTTKLVLLVTSRSHFTNHPSSPRPVTIPDPLVPFGHNLLRTNGLNKTTNGYSKTVPNNVQPSVNDVTIPLIHIDVNIHLVAVFQKSSDPRHPWCYKPRYVK